MWLQNDSFSLLTHQILWYQATGEGYDEIFEKIILIVYTLPKQYLRGYREQASAFCLEFIPKIPRIICQFRYTGRAFECYLSKSVSLQIKTFLRSRYREAKQENVLIHYHSMGHSDTYQDAEEIHEDLALQREGAGGYGKIPPQRILILALVKAFSIPPSLYGEIAAACSMTEEQFCKKLMNVRSLEQERIQRFESLQRMRDRYYTQMLSIQYELSQEEICHRRDALLVQQEKIRRKLARTRERIREFPLQIPHRVVASLLNIPKGTVDSSIFYLKQRMESIPRPEEEIPVR